MRKLIVFNNVSLDGYFTGSNGDISWTSKNSKDPELQAFVRDNASGEGELLFGRITYELMASYWPTPMAMQNDPVVAKGMNDLKKVVFSRTMDQASWQNTRLLKGDLIEETRKLKQEPGSGLVILGSGSIVAQLAKAGLIDEFQLMVNPIVLGAGRTLFEGLDRKHELKLIKSRTFPSGHVFLTYEPEK